MVQVLGLREARYLVRADTRRMPYPPHLSIMARASTQSIHTAGLPCACVRVCVRVRALSRARSLCLSRARSLSLSRARSLSHLCPRRAVNICRTCVPSARSHSRSAAHPNMRGEYTRGGNANTRKHEEPAGETQEHRAMHGDARWRRMSQLALHGFEAQI